MASRDNLNIGSQSRAQADVSSQLGTDHLSREHQAHARPLFCGAALLEAVLKFTGREFLEVDEIKAMRLCSRSLKHLVDSMAPLTGIRVEDGNQISEMLQDCGKLLLPRAEALDLPLPIAESADQVFILNSHDFKYLKSFSFYADKNWGPMLSNGMLTRLTALTSLEIWHHGPIDPQALLCCLSHSNLKSLQNLSFIKDEDGHEDTIEISSPYLLRLGATAFANLSKLQSLCLRSSFFLLANAPRIFPDEDLLSSLTKLVINAGKFPKHQQNNFSTPRWPNLRDLTLWDVKDQAMINFVTESTWFRSLKVLDIRAGAKGICLKNIKKGVELQELSICWDRPSDDGLKEFTLPKLKKLVLDGNVFGNDGADLIDVSKSPMLEDFEIYGYGLAFFINLKKPPAKLRRLQINNGKLDDEAAQLLSLNWISKCEEVSLDGAGVFLIRVFSPYGRDVAAGPKWPLLRVLNVSNRTDGFHTAFLLNLMNRCVPGHGHHADFPNLTHFMLNLDSAISEYLTHYLKTGFPMITLWPKLEEFVVKSSTESLCFKKNSDGTGMEVQEKKWATY